jgi:hypothetical protein
MSENSDNIHLLPLDNYNDFENSSSESEDNDSIEIVSNVDEEENDIVDVTKQLAFSSDDESDFDGDGNNCSSLDGIVSHCSLLDDVCFKSNIDASDDDPVEYSPLNVSVPSSSSHSQLVVPDTVASSNNKIETTSKRKRRQWSVAEKLSALATFKLNQSKHRTAVEHGCTTAQLRKWVKDEVKLINISKEKKGMLFQFIWSITVNLFI